MNPQFHIKNSLLKLFCFCAATLLFYSLYQLPNGKEQRISRKFNAKPNKELMQLVTPPETDDSDLESSDNEQRYFVRSAQCKMPYADPFSLEAMKIYKPLPIENCTNSEYMIESIFDENLRRYVLHIKEHVAMNFKNYSGDIDCCYRQIVRKTDEDNGYDYLSCIIFHQDFIVPPHIEGITVECYSANFTKLLQQDAFTFIQWKNLRNSNQKGPNIRKPNVLLFGLDALSRINFRRTMAKTHAFMQRNKWHEMEGYNKVGDNTFPNLMAVLAGYNETTANIKCQVNEKGGLDNCPIIWRYFQEVGYRTAYAEDETVMSTFNYLKAGFQSPPTDHYLRPFISAFEDRLVEQRRCGLRTCLGIRYTAEYIYDFAKDFAQRYTDEPVFGLFWSNSFTHNCYDTASAMDHVILNYLEEFEKSGILERSIVVFFSDHGMRWGELTYLPDGFLEERLPMLYIWLPDWFAKQYPAYVRALQVNKNRLTSPYDLHMTLKHLAELAAEEHVKLPHAFDCPQCQSLFLAVPEIRNCSVASIPEHYCACVPYEVISSEESIKNITRLVIDEMNQYLTRRNFTGICSEWLFDDLHYAEKRLNLEDIETEKEVSEGLHEDHMTYRLKFTTKPNKAVFQATVIYHRFNNTIDVDVESISRLTSYENDSKCVDDKQAKKYCICRNAISE